jgi:hypothetical protein
MIAKRRSARSEATYVAIALLFLVVGLGLLWFAQSVIGLKGDAVLVAILVAPLLVYLVLSDRIQEFAAGSVSVKLREASRSTVGKVVSELGPVFDPRSPVEKVNPNQPMVAELKQGSGTYDREEVLHGIRQHEGLAPVALLIVLDTRDRVLAYMTYRSALDLLSNTHEGDQFIDLVNKGDSYAFQGSRRFSAVITETLTAETTNAKALALMEETGLDALVVVDRKKQFEGIVERNRVLSQMMLALVSLPPEDAASG